MRGRKEVKKVCKSKIRQCTHIINSFKWYIVHVSWELILFDKVINALIFVNRNDKSTSVNSAEGDHDVMTSFVSVFFSVRLLSVLRGHSFFSSPPQRPMTSDFEGFLYQILSITLFSYLNSWERASISLLNVQC